MNATVCILASGEASSSMPPTPESDTGDAVLPHIPEGSEAWQGTLSPSPRSSKSRKAVNSHSTALTCAVSGETNCLATMTSYLSLKQARQMLLKHSGALSASSVRAPP